jgi:hypothetical protein
MDCDERLVNFARLTAVNGEGSSLFGKRTILALATNTGSLITAERGPVNPADKTFLNVSLCVPDEIQ